jgi:NTP pyrophosphatase (non-canonical NTP hydrolase)
MFGKKHRPETIEKIKEKRKLQIMPEYPKGSKHHWYGKHHTEESKEKIRKARKRYWKTLHSIPKL